MNSATEGPAINLPRAGEAPSPSLSEQVYDYLSERIIRGQIRYGDRLDIRSIASMLNVSAMPIRDALKRLEMEGIVVIRPRSSSFVRVPTRTMTLAAVDARRMLELFAVREIYARVTQPDLAGLRTILDEMRLIAHNSDDGRPRSVIDRYIELDRRFHTELCALARNEYLDRYYRETSMHLSMSFRYGVGVCHGIEATFRDHEQVCSLLAENSIQAVDALEAHLLKSKENILREPTFQMLEE